MKLYFMRHGEASDDAPTDELRPLTEKGRERIKFAAKALRRINVTLDTIYASPRVRAQQTASLIAETQDLAVETREELNFSFTVEALKKLLAGKPEEAHILMVGHNPSISEVIMAISGSNVNMKTGSIARLDLYPPAVRGASLRWLLTPRILDALGD
jgi:phosphohistidine phosphatase